MLPPTEIAAHLLLLAIRLQQLASFAPWTADNRFRVLYDAKALDFAGDEVRVVIQNLRMSNKMVKQSGQALVGEELAAALKELGAGEAWAR